MPRVSVISGAYNIEGVFSFHKSMESILTGELEDFEFIICDDGSSDKTWELLSEYAKRDARIVLLKNEENKGLAFSLNRCIEIAKGEYIARHDLDDYSHKERLKKQIDYLDKNKDVSLLGTQAYLFDKNGVWGKEHFPVKVTKRDFLFTSPYQHGAVVFRREALVSAGGYRVAKETMRAEDYDLFMTMHMTQKGENLDEFLYYFCEDDSSKKRRKYRYRIGEMKVRFRGFKRLGLMPRGFFYAIKPLIVGLIPPSLLDRLKKKRARREILEESDE